MSNPFAGADPWEVSTERLLPDGNHVVQIVNAEMGQSTNRHPQIELQFRNPNGEIRDWLVITEATVGKVVALCHATGVPLPTEEDIEGGHGMVLKQAYVDNF